MLRLITLRPAQILFIDTTGFLVILLSQLTLTFYTGRRGMWRRLLIFLTKRQV